MSWENGILSSVAIFPPIFYMPLSLKFVFVFVNVYPHQSRHHISTLSAQPPLSSLSQLHEWWRRENKTKQLSRHRAIIIVPKFVPSSWSGVSIANILVIRWQLSCIKGTLKIVSISWTIITIHITSKKLGLKMVILTSLLVARWGGDVGEEVKLKEKQVGTASRWLSGPTQPSSNGDENLRGGSAASSFSKECDDIIIWHFSKEYDIIVWRTSDAITVSLVTACWNGQSFGM